MSIVKMRGLRLLAVKADSDALLHDIQTLGCLEISDVPEDISSSEALSMLEKVQNTESQRRSELEKLEEALNILNKYAPHTGNPFSSKLKIPEGKFFDMTELKEGTEAARRIQTMSDGISLAAEEESGLIRTMEVLTPWEKLELPIELKNTEQCAAMTGTVPSSVPVSKLEEAVSEAGEETALYILSSQRGEHRFLVISHKSCQNAVRTALNKLGYAPVSFPELTGTVKDNIKNTQNRIRELNAEKLGFSTQIKAESKSRDILKICADRLGTLLSLEEAKTRLLATQETLYITGWFPAYDTAALEDILEKYDCAWEINEAEKTDSSQIPVKIKNSLLSRCIARMNARYSRSTDTPSKIHMLMALLFILIFGIMTADMGCGLLMVLTSLFVRKAAKPAGAVKNFFILLSYCGISSTAFGALTANFFSSFAAKLMVIIQPENAFDWFWQPFLSFPDRLLIIAAGSAVLVLSNLIAMIIMRSKGEPLNVRILLGGIVSGMILLLAGNLILLGLHILGKTQGDHILTACLALLGGIIDFIFSLLACYAYDLSLRCRQCFSKNEDAVDRTFRPLAIRTKYVDVVKE